MDSPAGPCEWCGGQQSWTFIRGEMYVSCDEGCIPIPLEGLVPPLDSEVLHAAERLELMEPLEEGGVEPLEGGDAKTSAERIDVPPKGWLSTLWLGTPSRPGV